MASFGRNNLALCALVLVKAGSVRTQFEIKVPHALVGSLSAREPFKENRMKFPPYHSFILDGESVFNELEWLHLLSVSKIGIRTTLWDKARI